MRPLQSNKNHCKRDLPDVLCLARGYHIRIKLYSLVSYTAYVFLNYLYTLNRVFCRGQSFVCLHFYLYSMGKLVNVRVLVCGGVPGSRYRPILTLDGSGVGRDYDAARER